MMVVHDKFDEELQCYYAEVYPNLSELEAEKKHDELLVNAEQNDIISICKIIKETIV